WIVFGLFSVRTPHALVRTRIRVEYDDPFVSVAVGDEQFVRLRVDEHVGRLPEILRVLVRLLLAALPDLHDELAGLGELQNLIFVALTADPDEALRIDVDAVLRRGPVVAGTIAAPTLHVVAVGIEFHDRRASLLSGPHDARPMQDPDVILFVGRGAG